MGGVSATTQLLDGPRAVLIALPELQSARPAVDREEQRLVHIRKVLWERRQRERADREGADLGPVAPPEPPQRSHAVRQEQQRPVHAGEILNVLDLLDPHRFGLGHVSLPYSPVSDEEQRPAHFGEKRGGAGG